MLSFFKKIFRDPTADWPRLVSDSVLGELRLSDDAEWWEGRITVGSQTLGFKIGGEGKPDSRLMAHAHDIVRSPLIGVGTCAHEAETWAAGESTVAVC